MYIFKNFINFLEIYGQENLGCGYEINWTQVHRMIVDNNMFDFNDELESVIYHDDESFDSEEFRDRCYKYIEEQILKGYPVWHLFKLSKHLTKVLQDEEDKQTMEMFKKKYNKHLCYRCKHFKNNIVVYEKFNRIPIKDYIEMHPNANPIVLNLSHEMYCKYREERVKYINEHEKEFNIHWHDKERGINRQLTKEGFSDKKPLQKNAISYILGIFVIIGAVAFSVFMAKYSIFHPLLEAIDGLLSNRILNLYYDNMNHEGMLHTWFLWGQERNTYFFDLGIVRFFYWFGIVPGVLYYGVQCILLWFNYRKKDWLTLLLVVFITIYSIFEAHYISDYSGRNYILLCLGMYIGDMLEDK